MTQIINLYGGPGSGKSTTAAGLFNLMKNNGYSVELVTEVAKDYTWNEDRVSLDNQVLLFGEQFHRMFRLEDKVDFIITDSPLLLNNIYSHGIFECVEFENMVNYMHNRYPNHNFFIKRTKPFVQNGRNQTEQEASWLDTSVKDYLNRSDESFTSVEGNHSASGVIFNILEKELDGKTV